MIEYKGLPARVRRIVKVYDYCIESVQMYPFYNTSIKIQLKEGYTRDLKNVIYLGDGEDMENLIRALKSITKPSTRDIKVALYGFECPICGRRVSKGSNYTSMGGLNLCSMCG